MQHENYHRFPLPYHRYCQRISKVSYISIFKSFSTKYSNHIFIDYRECSKSQCTACKNYFPDGPAGYDCAGQCGLCNLCPYNPTIKECDVYCKNGVAACTETCNKGKAICLNCKC